MARMLYPECVPKEVYDKPNYVGDHLIRHYGALGLAAYLRDACRDPATAETEIVGGIGRLVLRADGSDIWEPIDTGRTAQSAAPMPRHADPALAESRRAVCQACPSLVDFRCSVAGCGCAGEGKPGVWSSRCPLGKWPAADCPLSTTH